VEGEDLNQYVCIERENQTALIMDEFYSHYFYNGKEMSLADGGLDDNTKWPKTISSASYIQDVNKDPVLIINGLTKNWRCPSFRCCWIMGLAPLIEMLGSAGSYLDGGANAPLQKLALPLMDLDFIRRDAWAIQKHFKKKRDFLLSELDRLGIKVKHKPYATFYIWGELSDLPSPLNDCFCFLTECTRHKIICVPVIFFDINPRSVRNIPKSSCITNVRFSYGPSMRNLTVGVKNMEELIDKWRKSPQDFSEYIVDAIERNKKELAAL